MPRRVLALVGDFHRAKDSSFWLGRTGLTGRRDRSDRWLAALSSTGLTGIRDQSDRYSRAEKGSIRVS